MLASLPFVFFPEGALTNCLSGHFFQLSAYPIALSPPFHISQQKNMFESNTNNDIFCIQLCFVPLFFHVVIVVGYSI